MDYIIYPDASLEGLRGTDKELQIGGRCNESENEYHINTVELMAVFFCLKYFCNLETGLHVMQKLDSTTAVTYINKKEGQHQTHATAWQKNLS